MGWIISKALYKSLHCSQGLEEESSEDTCSGGELSAPLSGNPTQLAYLPPDKMTAFSRLSRFGMTFKPLTESLGEELLTLYREDFPARTYPVQEREQGLKESDQECGNTWQGLLAKFDPVLSLWKTAQCSLLEDLEQSLETWPRWGSMRNGACYQRRESVRHTSESVFGFSLPTPVASDATSGAVIGKNDTYYTTSTGMPRKVNQKGTDGSVGLGRLVQMWPTPTAHNAKETNAPSEALRHEPTLASRVGGHLNPTWVEWLMGWPLGWTDLKPLAMDKFQSWLRQHSEY